MLSLIKKRRKRYKRARPGTGLKARLREQVEEQIQRGVPRQRIYDELMAKSRAVLNDSRSPRPHHEANVYMSVAGQVRHVMMARNQQAARHEKEGQVDQAIRLYEANLADGFEGVRPYKGLRQIYTRQGRYVEAIRVCRAYLALPERAYGPNRDAFRRHVRRLQDRIT